MTTATPEQIKILKDYKTALTGIYKTWPRKPSLEDHTRAREYFIKHGRVPEDLEGLIDFVKGPEDLDAPGIVGNDKKKIKEVATQANFNYIPIYPADATTSARLWDLAEELTTGPAAPLLDELRAKAEEETAKKYPGGAADPEGTAHPGIVAENRFYQMLFDVDHLARLIKALEDQIDNTTYNNYYNLPAVSMLPNGPMVQDLFFALAAGERVDEIARDAGYIIKPSPKGGLIYTHETPKYTNRIFIKTPELLENNRANLTTIKLFNFIIQRAAQFSPHDRVILDYDELVKLGIYKNARSAYKGVQTFHANMKGNLLLSCVLKGKERRGFQDDFFLRLEHNTKAATIYLNTQYAGYFARKYTDFPAWAYSLKDVKAFLLVRYICARARQSGQNLTKKAIKGTPCLSFNISMDKVREVLGLPTPERVKIEYQRKYNERIYAPIVRAITAINETIDALDDPEAAHIIKINDKGAAAAMKKGIDTFLQCDLEILIHDNETTNRYIEHAKKRTEIQEEQAAIYNDELTREAARERARKAKKIKDGKTTPAG